MTTDHLLGAVIGFAVAWIAAWLVFRSSPSAAKRRETVESGDRLQQVAGRLQQIANELERRGVAAVERDRSGTPMLFHFVGDENVIGSSSAVRRRAEIQGTEP